MVVNLLYRSAKKFMHIFIAVILALTAGLIVWYYIQANVPTVNVVIAKTRLSVGTTIGPQHVTVIQRPKVAVPMDAITDPKDVLGKTVVMGTVLNEDVIRKQHIDAGKGGLTARLATLAPGRAASDLPVETSSGLTGLNIGDKVNIYSEVGVPSGSGAAGMVVPVAQEAIILATPDEKGKQSEGQLSTSAGKGSYIIAVLPEETQKVAEAIVRGKKFSIFLLSIGGVDQ